MLQPLTLSSDLLQLVELKSGETYNGHMVQCDSWMNVHLREVICTSKASQKAGCSQQHRSSAVADSLLLCRMVTDSGECLRHTSGETP